MFKKILIANRGEIAIRVVRACREMGIRSVAVFSEADRRALHVRYSDEAHFIGPSPASESYLVIDKIIDVARKSDAEAIHPGYGFLAENPRFADRCEKEKIKLIGPSAYAMRTMGSKTLARKTVQAAGVPVVPGTVEPIASEEEVLRVAREIGFPVMLKATAGGGGKGLRLVREEEELRSSLRMAKSEAKSAFSDDSVYVEKYIENPRHVEIQILGDGHGNYVHLFERECSIQRRHQKVIEESPSVIVTPAMRAAMGKVAIEAARAVKYEGAGTCEFLVDRNRNFFFLEMNTRLQVEHPVTERVTGVDIVKEQILVAAGEKLSIRQDNVSQAGHAIECRIYAEDPDRNFFPCPGLITSLRTPGGPGVRDDSGVYEGFEIPIYYDPIISKLVAWGKDRTEAIARMKRALTEYVVTGVKTTIPFHIRVMNNRHFIEGNFDTDFIDKVFFKEEQERELKHGDVAVITAAIQLFLGERKRAMAQKSVEGEGQVSMWKYSTRPGIRKLG
ncbi:MAG: acetyl-CoA carboxylase biotin carboxylase subunit [Deltaproteobacteria bacterium]|nr:acetyl-CoA carboxylase biotin carboxylase subunit [Deltaproteobacteria bacterium]